MKKTIMLMGLCLVVGVSLYHGIVVRKYEIRSEKINSDVKITLITDLHSKIYGKNQEKLLSKIEEWGPDLICFSGDILDDIEDEKGLIILLEGLKDKGIPMYYVTGNHEIKIGRLAYVKNLFRSYGISVLDGQKEELSVRDNLIHIYGIDDPMAFKTKGDFVDELLKYKEITSENYSILLSHRPEYVQVYREINIDLIMAGHAHGGQVRIPFVLNGLFSPQQGIFPKYAGGNYNLGKNNLLVSRGLAKNVFLPRVFNPPEIVNITLRPRS